MLNEQQIPCPVCQTHIPFDTYALLSGTQFTCPKCFASIGLASNSKSTLSATVEKFDALKAKNQQMKSDHSMQ